MVENTVGRVRIGPPRQQRMQPALTERFAGPGWIYACVLMQLVCQLALLVQELTPARVFIRSAAFGTSLFFLLAIPSRPQASGSVRTLAFIVIVIITLCTLNPLGGAPVAVIAHWAFNLAIIGPVLWVGRLRAPPGTLERVLLILWAFHTVGSLLGVLQTYFPGQFQPDLTTISERRHLMIRLASGEWIPRPSGLSDSPGGAGANGIYAALLGVGVVLVRPFRFARVAGALSMMLGMMCVYLSQVRSALVMLLVCFIVIASLSALAGRLSRVWGLVLLLGVVTLGGFYFALGVGGDMMTTRLTSLIDRDPGSVYYGSRGVLLEETFTIILPKYPLGAGLGHWGMMNSYFGSAAHEIGTEIQVMGWVIDGGLPLVLAYMVAVLAAIFQACRAAQARDDRQATWSAIVAGYSVGALALCFSYPLFMSAGGLEFWLVNATLMQEMFASGRSRSVPSPV
jgi:hypothetical protein